MKLLVIDNFDSFTYNLVECFRQLGQEEIDVFRNDVIPFERLGEYDAVLLSPGPGVPEEAVGMMRLLQEWPAEKPLLGVCLGLQAIAVHFGGRLRNLGRVYHGIATEVTQTAIADPLLTGIPKVFLAGRYHSWVAELESLPACLAVTAVDHAGQIMAVRHTERPIHAVQFHPESVLTLSGAAMLGNFLRIVGQQPRATQPAEAATAASAKASPVAELQFAQGGRSRRPAGNFKQALEKLHAYLALDAEEAYAALSEIAEGRPAPAQVAAFLGSYLMRPVSVEELRGFRKALLDRCLPLDLDSRPVMDLCGTGGDAKDTFNISTLAAFVTAGAGHAVAKHGNYGVSSICGSSDVMQALGYQFTTDGDRLRRELEGAGICFLHAPLFHPAMKAVAPIRRELGVKTFFNMLGPLVNPARPHAQCTGVFSLELARLYQYLMQGEEIRFTVLHGTDGYDEASLTAPLHVIRRQGESRLLPEDLGLPALAPEALHGGASVAESAQIFRDILQGRGTAAQQAVVTANAAFAIQTAGGGTYAEALAAARESLASGRALQSFRSLITISQHA